MKGRPSNWFCLRSLWPPFLPHLKTQMMSIQAPVSSMRYSVGAHIDCLLLLWGFVLGVCGLLLLWVCCLLAWPQSSAALGRFGFVCLLSSAFEGPCGLYGYVTAQRRLKVANMWLYTNRGRRAKHCQAAPPCHLRQPLMRKVGDRVPKQLLSRASRFQVADTSFGILV